MNVRMWMLAVGIAWCCLAASAPAVTIDDVAVVNAEGNVWVRHHDTLSDLPDPKTYNDGFGALRTVSAGPDNNLVIAGDLGQVWVRNAADLHSDVAHDAGYGSVVDSAFDSNGNIVVASKDILFLRSATLGDISRATGFQVGTQGIDSVALQDNNDMVVNWELNGGDVRIYRDRGDGTMDVVTNANGFVGLSAITIQSADRIAVGNTSGNLFFRDSAIGYLGQINGLGSISALACLSDDTVIAGNTSGTLYALAADGSSILASAGGYGTVSAIAVQSDDDVIVANAEGVLRRVTIDFSGGSPEEIFQVTGYGDGFGTITDVAVLKVPEPSSVALLAVGMAVLALSRWRKRRG
ncbi:MAG: PEP-CTERM sorting domain-containing protein [Planctomycetia bacterium]|nr:PEP-CTERM sorting domain-containing protein [Planctomycetia bacterium]